MICDRNWSCLRSPALAGLADQFPVRGRRIIADDPRIDRLAAEAIAAYERALMMRYGVSRRPSEELAQILIEARDALLGMLHVATGDGAAARQAESKARIALDRIRSILGP